ncbi:hypothetical protein [Sulfitobacter geojensis]|uniref:Uncharacterized protein n=1 Tax=Sulfitobacter geojensis TaxID=1342299 RepID=A0AAE3B852_9RHOB|nr:hypothetical protein [Sulfitobacter geojensis]MBM1691607.1 hypothetical protein [Sulfitobacter geojensis]MBM1695673.1 hypothetical protein [Sulfitobacter geojensis]MBM1707838.1 hypothetical protein [Sulfitobacter geojensis]MBM1711897.1 hypothetical protein [Sulfitobacter geojensis]MBM1715962.1 hypothetical protein [Sulfitobacter geojensis]
MSKSPRIRRFTAYIDLMPGTPSKIIVTGQVETKGSAHVPRLKRNEGPHTTGTTLALDLSIHSTGGSGTHAFDFIDVGYEAPANKDQYKKVRILWSDGVLCDLDVSETH